MLQGPNRPVFPAKLSRHPVRVILSLLWRAGVRRDRRVCIRFRFRFVGATRRPAVRTRADSATIRRHDVLVNASRTHAVGAVGGVIAPVRYGRARSSPPVALVAFVAVRRAGPRLRVPVAAGRRLRGFREIRFRDTKTRVPAVRTTRPEDLPPPCAHVARTRRRVSTSTDDPVPGRVF